MGKKLLGDQPWTTQYTLKLKLFEMSAEISCMRGDIDQMSPCLDQVLLNARSFDDSLKASSLLIRLLVSQSKYDDAMGNCLTILSNLGEVFPEEMGSLVLNLNELLKLHSTLRNVTSGQFTQLPKMTSHNKLWAMKFMDFLCKISVISKPGLLPFLSCRMVMLTFEYGFCGGSIIG